MVTAHTTYKIKAKYERFDTDTVDNSSNILINTNLLRKSIRFDLVTILQTDSIEGYNFYILSLSFQQLF